jgi:hypothetical protein
MKTETTGPALLGTPYVLRGRGAAWPNRWPLAKPPCGTSKVSWSAGRPGPFSRIEKRALPAPEEPPALRVPACPICCGPAWPPFSHCFACRTLVHRLNLPLTPVLPAFLCPLPSPLYTVLVGYKESPVEEARQLFAKRLGELFSIFLTDHRACIESVLGGHVELVLPVPSSSRPGRGPLEWAGRLAGLAIAALGCQARWLPSAMQRAPGDIGHMRPNAGAFVVPPVERGAVHGSRIVLLDDSYVSGSRSQSAAAALRLARARGVVIAPLGRVLRPERFGAHAAFVAQTAEGEGHRARCVVAQTCAGTE